MTVSPRLPVAVTVTAVRPEGVWSGPAWTNTGTGTAIPSFDLEVPAAQPYSQPYWLVKPPQTATYVVDDQTLVGLADTPVEQMRIQLTVAGCPIELLRPIVSRYNDRLEGEKVRSLAVVPPVAVNLPLAPDLTTNVAVFPSQVARKLQATVKANMANAEEHFVWQRPAAGASRRHPNPSSSVSRGPAGTDLRGDAAGRGGERDPSRVRAGQRKRHRCGDVYHRLRAYPPTDGVPSGGCETGAVRYPRDRAPRRVHHGRGRRSARGAAPAWASRSRCCKRTT